MSSSIKERRASGPRRSSLGSSGGANIPPLSEVLLLEEKFPEPSALGGSGGGEMLACSGGSSEALGASSMLTFRSRRASVLSVSSQEDDGTTELFRQTDHRKERAVEEFTAQCLVLLKSNQASPVSQHIPNASSSSPSSIRQAIDRLQLCFQKQCDDVSETRKRYLAEKEKHEQVKETLFELQRTTDDIIIHNQHLTTKIEVLTSQLFRETQLRPDHSRGASSPSLRRRTATSPSHQNQTSVPSPSGNSSSGLHSPTIPLLSIAGDDIGGASLSGEFLPPPDKAMPNTIIGLQNELLKCNRRLQEYESKLSSRESDPIRSPEARLQLELEQANARIAEQDEHITKLMDLLQSQSSGNYQGPVGASDDDDDMSLEGCCKLERASFETEQHANEE